jgi:signal peptidase I
MSHSDPMHEGGTRGPSKNEVQDAINRNDEISKNSARGQEKNPGDSTREGGPVRPGTQHSFMNSRHFLLFAIIVIAIVLPFRLFVAKPFLVSGTSMYPSFDTFHYLIVDQLTYRIEGPERGDVIIFRFPQNPSRFFIKRIIGLPSETVELSGNTVTIKNDEHPEGFVLDEPYIAPENARVSEMSVTLGDDEYFVMGDNRKASADSRYWGPLERSRIVGRAFVRLFPFTELSILPGKTSYEAPDASGDDGIDE